MAKNQRQRRPLQDDTRSAKQTVRERAQVSKRQRDRIEENRDRRERRRERQRLRRQQVDSIRSPKEDMRTERMDSRVIPVEDTFLGQPVGMPQELPVLIGERWGGVDTNQGISNSTETTLIWEIPTFTTERNGYPALGIGSSSQFTNFRIPAGLAGVWHITLHVTWAATSFSGIRTTYIKFVGGSPIIAYNSWDGESTSGEVNTHYLFQEGDEFYASCQQDSGAALDVIGDSSGQFTYIELIFAGK